MVSKGRLKIFINMELYSKSATAVKIAKIANHPVAGILTRFDISGKIITFYISKTYMSSCCLQKLMNQNFPISCTCTEI